MNSDIFLERYRKLKEKYNVEHLLGENKKVIFILESPHIDELVNKAPVSGLSGKAMSKVIFGVEEKIPLGIKIKGMPKSEIGIMNICSIPMQRAAYSNPKVEQLHGHFDGGDYNEFFNVFEKLRTNTKVMYKDQVKNDLQKLILADFTDSLSRVANEELVLIPCGKTANVFFEAANVQNPKWTVLTDMPHPSYGNWYKEKYRDVVDQVIHLVSPLNKI